MSRFNIAALEVNNLDQSIAMVVLKEGLLKNDLLFFLEKKYPRDFTNMLAQAEGYARAEKAFKLQDDEVTKKWQAGESSKPTLE